MDLLEYKVIYIGNLFMDCMNGIDINILSDSLMRKKIC